MKTSQLKIQPVLQLISNLTGLRLIILLLWGASAPAQTPDHSWPVAEYLRLGMPNPDRFWTIADYRICRDLLLQLDRTNRAALPRFDNPNSGPVFARLVNSTNTLLLTNGTLPAPERKSFFYALLNSYPSFQDLYKLDLIDPAFHHEAIELNHAFLRMARSAIDLDGKALPRGVGENTDTIFRFAEAFRSRYDSLLAKDPRNSLVPRGNQFTFLGAQCALTIGRLVPWLADGGGLPEAERLAAVRYLREDGPTVWKHIVRGSQQPVLDDLDAVIRRTRHERVRRELEMLRSELHALMGSSAAPH